LVDRDMYGVCRLRGRNDSFATRELDRGLERGQLRYGDRLDHFLVVKLADERRHAVIAEAARVERRRDERVAERVHLHQRCQTDSVAEVIGVDAFRQTRARGWLDGDDAELLLLARELVAREGEAEPREVGAAAGAGDDDIGFVVGLLELLLRLESDDAL